MNLYNRFYFYFIGIFFGLFILFISLKFRDNPISFDYFPNSRVISYVKKKHIDISDLAFCKMSCYNLDSISLQKNIINSTVNFKKSIIHNVRCKQYFLSCNNLNFILGNCSDSIILIDVFSNEFTCFDCN